MELIENRKFEELKATGRLPSPKGVALALLNLTRNDDYTATDVIHIVQSDPALAGRLLKLANAANQGLQRPVVSLSQAVMLLGVPMVTKTALGLSLLSEHRKGACKRFDYEGYWSRSLAAAIANQWLGYRAQTAADETFTCGLLSKVGMLALATLFPDEYDGVLAKAAEQPGELLSLERECFAFDHRALTVALLREWGLPSVFVQAVFHHEKPEEAGFEEGSRAFLIVHALHFSAYLAEMCMTADETARQRMLPRLYMLGARLGMDTDAVNVLTDQIVAEWQEWGTILKIPTRDVPPLAELAAALPGEAGMSSAAAHAPMRILVAEDSKSMRSMLERLLKSEGHIVETAANGREALARAVEFAPQIVVTDWVMPELDGLGLCKALRETKAGRMMYIIMLTVLEEEDRLVEAFEAGADDYVVKPFSERTFKARLRAGQRIVHLQEEILCEREDMRRSAGELALTNQRLLEVALTDALTQLPNRRYGLERFEQEWAAAVRKERPLSCMLLDIDRFKQINDTYGHDMGDAVLRRVAILLKQAVRREDVPCRLGGEEFLVICPDADLKSTAVAAERIRRQFEECIYEHAGHSLRLTASIGVAARDASMEGVDALLKMSDQALYTAKQSGRNRVVAYSRKSAPNK